ncbi:MAG: MlaD family protein [Candidatus Omnitrophota bacterium]
MTEKARYFKIGLFTLGALGLLCAGLIIFGATSYFDEPPILAETYFLQSVQGLDVGAPVKFSGVQVGKVKNIRFIKDEYKDEKSLKDLADHYKKVIVVFELETKYFLGFKNKNRKGMQDAVNYLVEKHILRVKMVGIGITGLVYLELGFQDPAEAPPLDEMNWKPTYLYIPSSPSMTTRFRDSVEKFLNKLDSDIYPLLTRLEQASVGFPAVVTKLDGILSHGEVISKNIEDITSTGKKYPSQMIFGEAPPKSRYDR